MTHCTSTTMASTAPVMIASSCCRKLPAIGDAVPHQDLVGGAAHAGQVDALGALRLGLLMISGSAWRPRPSSESSGSWPWTMMLTWSSFSTPRLILPVTGTGVPNRMSCSSVADHGAAPAVGQGAARTPAADRF